MRLNIRVSTVQSHLCDYTGPAVVEHPMPTLHPQIIEVLKLQEAAGLRPIEAMTPAEARAQMEATARARKAEPLHVKQVEEQEIAGPGGPIRLRLYWPDATGPVPAIAYY